MATFSPALSVAPLRWCMLRRARTIGCRLLFTAAMSAMTGVSALPVRPRPRAPGKLPLQSMLATAENSWKTTLMEDPKSQKGSPNTEPREVFGHWVDVVPTALPDPFLVAVAPSMLAELGLDPIDLCIAPPYNKHTRTWYQHVDALTTGSSYTVCV